MMNNISVVIVTKNEEHHIAACLQSVSMFSDVHVVDSASTDNTVHIAKEHGATVSHFQWNGRYPKKRQWCLDSLPLKQWVLFIDADERMTNTLASTIQNLPFDKAGYFIRGNYQINGQMLKFGLKNNKLCLIDRHKMHFPTVNDLDIADMGEIEGHYQPIFKSTHRTNTTGHLKPPLIHIDDTTLWYEKHMRYALWQATVNARKSNPPPVRLTKKIWHRTPFKPLCSFTHSYILCAGFLDGLHGIKHAYRRGLYYAMISRASKNLAHNDASTARSTDAP